MTLSGHRDEDGTFAVREHSRGPLIGRVRSIPLVWVAECAVCGWKSSAKQRPAVAHALTAHYRGHRS